jgi:hypothetical protein
MKSRTSIKVKEGWTGPGRRDGNIVPLAAEEDGLHMDMNKKGMYEWWYFDTHTESGYTVVVFFHASNPNPGVAGKTGVEIVLLRPNGERLQKFIPYKRKDFSASRKKADVRIGRNYLRSEHKEGGLPVYEIFIDEAGIGCDLKYTAEVNGWKPGSGDSQFGEMGSFSWIIPFARASVEGTITDGKSTFAVKGVGYHDHNWLDFQFPRIIEYWMWGRIYSKSYTLSYAYIQCNKKMDRHAVKVLMLAEGRDVILSTGEFDFKMDGFEFNPNAKHSYPKELKITIPSELKVSLHVKRILEAVDMLDYFSPILRFLAKYLLRLKPGYFRLRSDFEIDVQNEGKRKKERGSTLHEIVLFKSAGG